MQSLIAQGRACTHSKRRLVTYSAAGAIRSHAYHQHPVLGRSRQRWSLQIPPTHHANSPWIYGVAPRRFEQSSHSFNVRIFSCLLDTYEHEVVVPASSSMHHHRRLLSNLSMSAPRRRWPPQLHPRREMSSSILPLERRRNFTSQSKAGSSSASTIGADATAATPPISTPPESSSPPALPTAESVYENIIVPSSSGSSGGLATTPAPAGSSSSATPPAASTGTKKSSTSSSSPPPPRPKIHRKRRVLRDPDRDLINENRTRQQRFKEDVRLQTASNVYRALVGNVLICGAKLAAWMSSGSSALMAEFIHSVVDCGNQALLLVGLRNSNLAADRRHPYGYGKSVYFWALVSALGTFFLGAGVSMSHALQHLFHPSLEEITKEVWGVLIFSFTVDGYVLNKTIRESLADRPKGVSWLSHLANIRDPATLAILLEDGAACLGVVMALGGIAASHYTANPMYDAVAGVGISALLGAMGLTLVRVNHRFLLGQGVDKEITDDIERILLSRRSIDSIGSVQSQWTGPETFSYKAEVDFDGTFLAAKLLPIYQQEFLQIRDTMDDELQVLLALYTEDVMRTVEREVRHVEALIRKRHPGAEYIELEPMSIHADHLAINDNLEDELRRVESDALDRYLRTLKKEGSTVSEELQPPSNTSGRSS